MRICVQCGLEKDIKEFGFSISADDFKSDCCKICNPRRRGRPKKTNQHIKRLNGRPRTKLYKSEVDEIVNRYKLECIICYEEDVSCLHFHHIRDKKFNISKARNYTKTKEEIINEISKCIVVCANCHSRYHIGKRFCLLSDRPAQ